MKIICESIEDLNEILPVLRKRLKGSLGDSPVWSISVHCPVTGTIRDQIICYQLAQLTHHLKYLKAIVGLRIGEGRRYLVIED